MFKKVILTGNLLEWIDKMGTVCDEARFHAFVYEFGDEIGSGGECVIYKVHKPGDKKTYAVRIPKKALEHGWNPSSDERRSSHAPLAGGIKRDAEKKQTQPNSGDAGILSFKLDHSAMTAKVAGFKTDPSTGKPYSPERLKIPSEISDGEKSTRSHQSGPGHSRTVTSSL